MAVRLDSKQRNASSKSIQKSTNGQTRPGLSSQQTSFYGAGHGQTPSTLPMSNTEAIIDGLFNPYPSNNPSPFTIAPPRTPTATPILRAVSHDPQTPDGNQSKTIRASLSVPGRPSLPKALGRARRDLSADGSKKGRWWKLGVSQPGTPVESSHTGPENPALTHNHRREQRHKSSHSWSLGGHLTTDSELLATATDAVTSDMNTDGERDSRGSARPRRRTLTRAYDDRTITNLRGRAPPAIAVTDMD